MSAIPVPYIAGAGQQQQVLGHYAAAQKSGATVSIGALGHIGRIRWAPSLISTYCVLMRLKVGYIVTGAVTAATPMDFDAIIARGFTVDYNTAITNVNMATPAKTGQMRGTMSQSQMGTAGPGISTTAVISGQTNTLDAAPFAITTFLNQPSGNATVTQAIGTGGPMQTLYEWTGLGQHPVVLSNNEGVVVREVTAGVTTGTMALYLQWEWAEVFVF
jgi:hypothetical protein